MKIMCDEQGKQVLSQLIDVAIKSGAFASLKQINDIVSSVSEIKPEKSEEDKKK